LNRENKESFLRAVGWTLPNIDVDHLINPDGDTLQSIFITNTIYFDGSTMDKFFGPISLLKRAFALLEL
jgi:hypothetical protein